MDRNAKELKVGKSKVLGPEMVIPGGNRAGNDAKTAVLVAESAVVSRSLQVPFAAARPGYQTRRVDVSHMTPTQKNALASLVAGLDKNGATLESGRRVVNNSEAIRWLLEQIAKSAAAPVAPVAPVPAAAPVNPELRVNPVLRVPSEPSEPSERSE